MKKHIFRSILPCVWFGAVTGVGTAAVVVLYKYLAGKIIHLSDGLYAHLRSHLWLLPIAAAVLAGVAWLLGRFYDRHPDLQGSGIPSSIAAQRGVLRFRWQRNLISTFLLSLLNFLMGVPLGTEGPAVQMGTAIGMGTTRPSTKENNAWGRYAMTGGACAGFSVATGAPLTGLLFGIEEAHRRITPAILLVSATAVTCSEIVQQLLVPLLGVDAALLTARPLPTLSVEQIWIPVTVGAVMGLFAVVFLSYYQIIKRWIHHTLHRVPHGVKIGAVLLLTLLAGIWLDGSGSTGHHLMLSLFEGGYTVPLLLLLLAVRATLTLSANVSGMTGGIFVPTLVLGALLAAILGKGAVAIGLDGEYYTLILTLGLVACIASMMKIPLTAAVFAFELLGCGHNALSIITVCVVSYVITEICGVKSIIDTVLEDKTEALTADRPVVKSGGDFTVQTGAFADGKQVSDILWPAGVFVLSVTHGEGQKAAKGAHGRRVLCAGDILHVQYTTTDEPATLREIAEIVD